MPSRAAGWLTGQYTLSISWPFKVCQLSPICTWSWSSACFYTEANVSLFQNLMMWIFVHFWVFSPIFSVLLLIWLAIVGKYEKLEIKTNKQTKTIKKKTKTKYKKIYINVARKQYSYLEFTCQIKRNIGLHVINLWVILESRLFILRIMCVFVRFIHAIFHIGLLICGKALYTFCDAKFSPH